MNDDKGEWVEYNPIKSLIRELRLRPLYTHRNGEAEMPEVEGWYWIEQHGEWWIDMAWSSLDFETDKEIVRFDGSRHAMRGCKFYGPIPQPERQEIPHG